MTDFVPFTEYCDSTIRFNESGQLFELLPHQRVLFDLADELYLQDLWSQFLYSSIKKSGKTTLQAIQVIRWAETHPGDELILQANDYDQSVGRVFSAAAKLCRRNDIECEILADRITFPNEAVVKAIASDYAGEAGANQGFHGVDEPWGIVTEAGIRLLEELTPLINKPSIRFISSYAGWMNQSKWLWDLFLEGVGPDLHPQGKAERVHDELPLYLNREAKLFTYWDSGVEARRMPWQIGPRAESYYRQQQRSLRAGAYSRLHMNQWGTGDDKFITAEMFDAAVDPALSPIMSGGVLFGGWDASTKRDSTAVVFVAWDGDKIRVACHKIFKPGLFTPIDFEAVETYVKEVCSKNKVKKILADPFQLFSTIQSMQKAKYPIEEFNQTLGNLTVMASNLFDGFNNRTLKTYWAPDLREHALNAVAAESPRGYVIKKERAAGKIDGLIALGMAVTGAMTRGKTKSVEDHLRAQAITKGQVEVIPEGMDEVQAAFWKEITAEGS